MEQSADLDTADRCLHAGQDFFKLLALEVARLFAALLKLHLIGELHRVLPDEHANDLQDLEAFLHALLLLDDPCGLGLGVRLLAVVVELVFDWLECGLGLAAGVVNRAVGFSSFITCGFGIMATVAISWLFLGSWLAL